MVARVTAFRDMFITCTREPAFTIDETKELHKLIQGLHPYDILVSVTENTSGRNHLHVFVKWKDIIAKQYGVTRHIVKFYREKGWRYVPKSSLTITHESDTWAHDPRQMAGGYLDKGDTAYVHAIEGLTAEEIALGKALREENQKKAEKKTQVKSKKIAFATRVAEWIEKEGYRPDTIEQVAQLMSDFADTDEDLDMLVRSSTAARSLVFLVARKLKVSKKLYRESFVRFCYG